tara:strand:- start:595 stop:1572 length:978 start_codon:yes stop_codon:yes gene_type:complete
MKKIFITGGAGYVGSELVPSLLESEYIVTVLDLFIYGNTIKKHKNLNLINGDIRDKNLLDSALKGHDQVIHLACISNDPSFELNPTLGKEINFDAFEPLVRLSKKNNIKKFIYASSSSVYGIKKEKDVNEEMSLEPITEYSKYKADCENILNNYKSDKFSVTIVRPATVCGYSRRQRLDLVVNILSNLAYNKKEISVFGGKQLRPNIHIKDMVRAYELLLKTDAEKVNGKIYNVGFENQSVEKLAKTVKNIMGKDIKINYVDTNDNRSYHISSKKIKQELGFSAKFNIEDSVKDLKKAFDEKKLQNCLDNVEYFNIKKMQKINLK